MMPPSFFALDNLPRMYVYGLQAIVMMPPMRGLAFLYLSLREGLSLDIKAGKRGMKLDYKIKAEYGNI